MKRFITLSFFTAIVAVLLTSCVQDRQEIDQSYWLSKERAYVVYSEGSCSYFVIETDRGYAVLRSFISYKPYEGSVLYGDFSRYGIIDYYDRSNQMIMSADVQEYWLTYYDAQMALEYYCY